MTTTTTTTLDGVSVLVTGGGKGIGAVYVEELAKAGASVLATDVDVNAVTEVSERLRSAGYRVEGRGMDVTDPAGVNAALTHAADSFGGLDVLVNNAALFTSLLPLRSFLEIDPEEWTQVMRVNVGGLFLCCREAFPYLRDSGRGRIINIASTTALTGSPNLLHYITSKGAVIAFTRALAREVGPDNITVNAIAPGLTASGTAKEHVSEERFEAAASIRAIPRVQEPRDLVGALLFLASDGSQFITGQTLVVDGGAYMQ